MGRSEQVGKGVTSQQQQNQREVFSKTFDLLWTQAQMLFGEDAPQVICEASTSDNPQQYIEQYLPNAITA